MIEYYDDKQESQGLDDRFYRPAKFSEPQTLDETVEQMEEVATEAFNDGFFAGVILMVALALFIWSTWILFA